MMRLMHTALCRTQWCKVGVLTRYRRSLRACDQHFSQCHAAFLEAITTRICWRKALSLSPETTYPRRHGHLSNSQALEIFINHRSAPFKPFAFVHLSRDNNRPELVHELFNQHANGTEIIVASAMKNQQFIISTGCL